MGVNFWAIHSIIHFGPPTDVATFLQQMGRAGQLDVSSQHLMIFSARRLHCVSEDIKYCNNNHQCRQVLLCDL